MEMAVRYIERKDQCPQRNSSAGTTAEYIVSDMAGGLSPFIISTRLLMFN